LVTTVESGGTFVKVLNGVELADVMDKVGVADVCAINVFAACVDMPSRVCAAEVYRAFRVAAGWGVPAARGPHARMDASARKIRANFLKRVILIIVSVANFDNLLDVSRGYTVPIKNPAFQERRMSNY
jgi:hypothetical protein